MMKKDQIANEVERIINSVDTIEQVNASPFFKDKVLNKLYEEKEPQVGLFAWFRQKIIKLIIGYFHSCLDSEKNCLSYPC